MAIYCEKENKQTTKTQMTSVTFKLKIRLNPI